MTRDRAEYDRIRAESLKPTIDRIAAQMADLLDGISGIDSVAGRAKTADSYLKKAAKEHDGVFKYNDPINDIQDLVGLRIVVVYLRQVAPVIDLVQKYFRHIEVAVKEPDRASEFGYVGWHSLLIIPPDLKSSCDGWSPSIFELQIKTVFQHAWAQANHDLVYKEENGVVSKHAERLVYFAASQAWGADNAFESALSLLPGDREGAGEGE